jgi:hypothetical protein
LAGCRTAEGKARISAANSKHGRFTRAVKEKRRAELEAKRAAAAVRKTELGQLQAESMQLKRELARELRSRRAGSRSD